MAGIAQVPFAPYAGLAKRLGAIAKDADIDLGNAGFDGLDLDNKDFGSYIDGLDAKLKKLLAKKRGSEQLIESHSGGAVGVVRHPDTLEVKGLEQAVDLLGVGRGAEVEAPVVAAVLPEGEDEEGPVAPRRR